MLKQPHKTIIGAVAIVLCAGLAVGVSLLALEGLDGRLNNEVTLTILNRFETDGWYLVNFELRIPPNRRVYLPSRSIDGIPLWIKHEPAGVHEQAAARIRKLQIVGGRQTLANRPLEYPADPSLHGWLSWTTNDFSKPPGYSPLRTMKLGPDTNLVITVLEPRRLSWRLELNTLEWYLGTSAWPGKVKRLWKKKQISALKEPVAVGLLLQSEWMKSSPFSHRDMAKKWPEGVVVRSPSQTHDVDPANNVPTAGFGR